MKADKHIETIYDGTDPYREVVRARRINQQLVAASKYVTYMFFICVSICFAGLVFKKKPDIVGLVITGQTAQSFTLRRLAPGEFPSPLSRVTIAGAVSK